MILSAITSYVALKGADQAVNYLLKKLFDNGWSIINDQTYNARLTELTRQVFKEYIIKYPALIVDRKFPFYESNILYDEIAKYRFFKTNDTFKLTPDLFIKNPDIILPTQEEIDFFISLFKNIITKDKKIQKLFVEENYKTEIFKTADVVREVLEETKELKNAFVKAYSKTEEIPVKKEYSLPEIYIPRLVHPIKISDKGERIPIILSQVFHPEKPKKILLRGEGGIGKSIELTQLAAHFSSSDEYSFFPIHIRLRDYVNQSIDTLLQSYYPVWTNVPINQLLLILDGYDEVKATEREYFLRHLSHFARVYSSCSILISARNNFAGSFEIDEFEHYILNPFENVNIKNYVFKVLEKQVAQNFLKAIEGKSITTLFIKVPFYLAYFVELFKDNNVNIPENLKALLEAIVNHRIKKDSLRLYEENYDEYLYDLSARKFGFALNLLGETQLLRQDIFLLLNKDEQEKLKRLSLVESQDKISFTHLSFQEYFAAKVLSKERDFVKIKQFITFAPDYTRFKPKWQNTIRLLLELMKEGHNKNELLNLVSSQEPELLLNIEYNQISTQIRFDLFKKILNQSDRAYKNEAPYYSSDLARFAGINEDPAVVKYLFSIIEDESQTISIRHEHLYYVNFVTNKLLFDTSKLESLLEKLLLSNNHSLQKESINVLISLKIYNDKFVYLLTNILPNRELYQIREYIIHYLSEWPEKESLLDFYIESMEIYSNWLKANEQYGGLGYFFTMAISEIKHPHSICRIIDYINNHTAQVNDYNGIFQLEFIETIVNNAVLVFKDYNLIYDKMFEFYCTLNKLSLENYIINTSKFFIETKTNSKAFWSLAKNQKLEYYEELMLGLLADINILNDCVKKYKEEKIQSSFIWEVIYGLGRTTSSQLHNQFIIEFSKIDPVQFKYSLPINWIEIQQKRSNLDFELLLSKDKFQGQIINIFNKNGTDSLSKEQIFEYQRGGESIYSSLVVKVLYDFAKHGSSVKRSEVINLFNNNEWWEWFVINELYSYHKNGSTEISMLHINLIKTWCSNQIDKLNYKTAITDRSKTSWYYRNLEKYVAYFWIKYDFYLPETHIIDMICFDINDISLPDDKNKALYLMDFIIKKINNIEKIKAQIIENLKEGNLARLVLKNHILLCEKYDIYGAKPYIFRYFQEEIFDDFDIVIILDAYIKIGGKLEEFAYIFNSFNSNSNFHWALANRMRDDKIMAYILINNFLNKNIFYYNEERIIEGFKLLTSLGQIEGLKSLINWIKEHKNIPLSGLYDEDLKAINNLPKEEALNLICNLLEFVVINEIQTTGHFRIPIDTVFKMFREILINDQDCFLNGMSYLKGLIDKVKKTELKSRLRRLYYDIEKEFYIHKDGREPFEDVVQLINDYIK